MIIQKPTITGVTSISSGDTTTGQTDLAIAPGTKGSGNFIDCRVAGASKASIDYLGVVRGTRFLPAVTSVVSSDTHTPDADTTEMYIVTGQASSATFGTPTGTPVQGQKLLVRIKDSGVAAALSWNATGYRAGTTVSLPTTTIASKTLYLGFMYNSTDTKWDLMAYSDGY